MPDVRSGLLLATLGLVPGCYLSHEAPRDGDVEVCTFSYLDETGPIACGIDVTSRAACLDAAVCICQTRLPDGTGEQIEDCLVGIVDPRALATFSDVCPAEGPASRTLDEALSYFVEHWGRDLRTSASCGDIPALLGPR